MNRSLIRRAGLGTVVALALLTAPWRAGAAEGPDAPTSGTLESDLEQARAALEAARDELRSAARQLAEVSQDSGAAANPLAYAFDFAADPRKAVLGVIVVPGPAADGDVRGVRVQAVTPGSGAEQAGLQAGDLLLSIEGRSLVVSAEDGRPEVRLREEMTQFKPGDQVRIEYERDGQRHKTVAEASRPVALSLKDLPELQKLPTLNWTELDALDDLPDGPFGQNLLPPLQLASMDADLAAYFRTDGGVLVIAVPEAADIELKSGDVIRQIDGEAIHNPREALEKLAKLSGEDTLRLEVVRHGKTLRLETRMPEQLGVADAGRHLRFVRVPAPPLPPPWTPETARSP